MKQGHLGVQRRGECASEPDSIVDKMFAAATKKNARQPPARSNRDQHRRLNCFDDFVGAMRLPGTTCLRAAPRSDDDVIVFFAGCLTENLPNRFARLDDSLKRDAGLSQNVSLSI